MSPLKVAAVQLSLYPNIPERAMAEAERQVREASRKGARLVCLPEHWMLPNPPNSDHQISTHLARLAKELDVYINSGANYSLRGRQTYVTSVTISPEGSIVSRQDKIHLFRREKTVAVPGSRLDVFKVDGFRVAVIICHDLVFPETARIVALKGAELLLVPALISARGLGPWFIYLRARSLENRLPIVSSNIYAPPKFQGQSCIIDVIYDRKERMAEIVEDRAPNRKTSVVMKLDLRSKKPLREERLGELRV